MREFKLIFFPCVEQWFLVCVNVKVIDIVQKLPHLNEEDREEIANKITFLDINDSQFKSLDTFYQVILQVMAEIAGGRS